MKISIYSTVILAIFAGIMIPLALGADNESVPKEMNGMPLLFTEDFSQGSERWEPTDAAAWKIEMENGNAVYTQFQASKYEPSYRSPFNISLLKDLWISDFVLELKAKQTGEEYGHRDLCFIYNWRDPAHFYYTHIATAADPHANSIFLVDGAPRVSIALMRTDGTQWTQDYHTIRIVRDTKSGLIEVYFDDMAKPIMKAMDPHFTAGRIGVGSFDDTGKFDDIRIWGRQVEKPSE